MIALGVTGTDTGVGKTIVSCAIAAALSQRGKRVGVLKPVETGVDATDPNRDSARLAAAANARSESANATPYVFREPLAPLIAARRAQSAIDVARLDIAFREASRDRDVVIVEGAGGLLVPLTPELAFDSLFARWHLDVVVVAANRLGVINHARLTVAAAMAAGLHIRAVVLNDTAAATSDPSASTNGSALRELLPGLRVVRFPWVPPPCHHQALAEAAERCELIAAVVA